MKTKLICYDPLCEMHNKPKPTDEEIAQEAEQRFYKSPPISLYELILGAIKRSKATQ